MISVKKYADEVGEQVVLKFPDGQDLNINHGENLNLYFTPESLFENERDSYLFEIDEREDYDLYHIFDQMFKKVTSYKPANGKTDKDFRHLDKSSLHPLVRDEMIRWYSDDEDFEIASTVTISKQNGKICL